MSTPVSQPSFEELYKALQELPDDQRGEILAGELVVSPRPVNRHVVAGGQIYSEMLNRFFLAVAMTGLEGGLFYTNPSCT